MKNSQEHYEKMTTTPVAALIIRLGIPTTISMLITSIYNMADTYFVGTLGKSAQAATGILFTLQAIIQAIAFMLGQGSGTLVSKALADQNRKEASEYTSSAFFLGGGAGLILTVFGLVLIKPFMRVLGSTETILPYACDYGMWVLISCPFMICSLVLNNCLRYEGMAFYSMIGLTTGGILNIFGDAILVPNLGVYGAGLSTAVSQILSFLILLYFHFRKAQADIRIGHISRNLRLYFAVCKVGFPAMIRQGLSSISHGLLNNLTKPFGDAAIAAMSVVNRFSMFILCVGLGIGQGYQPVAAFNYQTKHYERVKKGLIVTTVLGFALVSILAIPGFIFAKEIVTAFQKNPEVIEIGTYALRWATIGSMFLPLSVPVNMLYQSIRKVGISSFLSLMRSGLAFIPVLVISTYFLGLTGIQISQPIGDMITGLVSVPFTIHFLRKKHSAN